MSKVYDLGVEDEGFVKFSYKGKEIEVDIFDIIDRFQNHSKTASEFSGEGEEVNPVSFIKDMLEKEFGLENISKATCAKFISKVMLIGAQLKKNIEALAL